MTPNETVPVVVDDLWDETIAQYVTQVSRGDRVYTVTTATSGPFVGDYEILGPDGYHSPGWATLDLAIACAANQLLPGTHAHPGDHARRAAPPHHRTAPRGAVCARRRRCLPLPRRSGHLDPAKSQGE
jgi:hypothetical protein